MDKRIDGKAGEVRDRVEGNSGREGGNRRKEGEDKGEL